MLPTILKMVKRWRECIAAHNRATSLHAWGRYDYKWLQLGRLGELSLKWEREREREGSEKERIIVIEQENFEGSNFITITMEHCMNPWKLNNRSFEDCLSAKKKPLENFPLYGLLPKVKLSLAVMQTICTSTCFCWTEWQSQREGPEPCWRMSYQHRSHRCDDWMYRRSPNLSP